MDKTITFEHLPQAVSELGSKIDSLHNLILRRQATGEEDDRILSSREASSLLGIAIQTLYIKIGRREIPHMKVGGKLRFSRKELMNYMKAGAKKTDDQLMTEADEELKRLEGRM